MKLVIGFIGMLFLVACTSKQKEHALPFYGNFDIITSETNGVQTIDTVYPKIPHFSYLNQDSVRIDSKQLKGKVWIANFFFTSCPSICPPMMAQMKRLNILTKDIADEVQFLSFSIDPSTDQPSVLRTYIKNNGLSTKNWHFFTGNEAQTHSLGVNHFMVHAKKDPMAAGGFAHSDGMVLVDKSGYVRGIYLGTQTKEVDKLNNDLRKLLAIEYGINSKK
ncbi:MAG: SCO family protein [Fluviicola sp.]|nr:SCO family protein [Fluviicola sp.]MBP6271137.1 SCO family protein [Fluviicola sp.]